MNGYFIASLFAAILALPIVLFLAFWISAVRNRNAVVGGAFIGVAAGFILVDGWVGTLIYDTPLPNAQPVATFFGGLFLCSILGIIFAMILDSLIAKASSQDYRRPRVSHE